MKYAVHTDQDEAILIMEDGGIAAFHNNGEHIISTMYQDKAEMFTMNYRMWSQLDDGKVYLRDWHTKQDIDDEVISNARQWLCPFAESFEEVGFQQLVNQYNSREI